MWNINTAFKTMGHDILLNRILCWMGSDMTDQYRFVDVHGEFSVHAEGNCSTVTSDSVT